MPVALIMGDNICNIPPYHVFGKNIGKVVEFSMVCYDNINNTLIS